MSEFKIIKQDKKGNIEKAAIMDAVAFYVKFQTPSVIYDEKDLPKNKQKNFEWTLELVVDEDTADAYDESVSEKQSSKKMSKAQAAKKYRLMSDEDDTKIDDEKFKAVNLDPKAKKFFVIKKAQRCQKRDGTPLKSLQPRAIQKVDGKPVDITFDKLVGNGSKVSLLMRYADQGSYGVSSYPDKLLVEDLIEYEQSGGQGIDEETQDFLGGEVDFADAPEQEVLQESEDSGEEFEEPDFEDDSDDIY